MSKWEEYGFPDPSMITIYSPAEGLEKALAERELPFSDVWDSEQIEQTEYIKKFKKIDRSWCNDFDTRLAGIATKYLNHIKIASVYDTEYESSLSEEQSHWSFSDLIQAASGNDTPITNVQFMYEIPVKWAIQRYNAIKLLKYADISKHRMWNTLSYFFDGYNISLNNQLCSEVQSIYETLRFLFSTLEPNKAVVIHQEVGIAVFSSNNYASGCVNELYATVKLELKTSLFPISQINMITLLNAYHYTNINKSIGFEHEGTNIYYSTSKIAWEMDRTTCMDGVVFSSSGTSYPRFTTGWYFLGCGVDMSSAFKYT